MTHESLQRRAAERNEYWVCPKTGIEMAPIPAGPFYAGNRHGAKMKTCSFSISRHPVTNEHWQAFVQDSGYEPDSTYPRPEMYLHHWQAGQPPRGLADHPVTWISFIDALHYARWAGLSIPSEWHWEKAARGLDGCACPWGDEFERAPELAHVKATQTAPIGAYPHVRTAFGCEQMIGNVSEFCLRSDVPTGAVLATPSPESVEATDLVVLRGSCYLRKSPRAMVCSHRRRLSATRRNSWTGLRMAFVSQTRKR